MCGLCGILQAEHWAERGSGRRGRLQRARVLDRVLAHAGLSLSEWSGKYVLKTQTGRSLVVEDLASVWPAAEQLSGRALDPLEPSLVSALASP
jgi:hypothetical protein